MTQGRARLFVDVSLLARPLLTRWMAAGSPRARGEGTDAADSLRGVPNFFRLYPFSGLHGRHARTTLPPVAVPEEVLLNVAIT